MEWMDSGKRSAPHEGPDETQLRRDIRYFERQIALLASPKSTWEHGALKCYQVLVRHRRKMLNEAKAGGAT